MDIVEIRAIEGPNIYSPKPVIKMTLDVKDLEDTPTRCITGFNQTLLHYLPGLARHHCCFDEPGGFLRRLEEGTYFPHVIEHVAIEILNVTGQDVKFGKARRNRGSMYDVVFGYREKAPALKAAEISVQLVDAILNSETFDLKSRLEKLERETIEAGLGPSTAAIAEEVKSRGIPVTRIGDGSLLILGYGAAQKRIQATMSQDTGCIAVDVACDKTLTKKLLSMAGIPVPGGLVVYTGEEAVEAAARIGYPVVIKPCDGNQGKGVSLNLKNPREVLEAFNLAREYSSKIIVEKHIHGRHYRVLVVGGKFVCASERIPAHVVGDGVHTVKELVDIANMDPMRGEGHEKPLTKIKLDPVVHMVLAKQGLSLEDVPREGQRVFLRQNGNLSTGGTAVDVTDLVCPENRFLAERAASIVGLDIAGIDITTGDIAVPVEQSGGAVIEVNAAPGIRMHLYPSSGKPRPVARAIVDMLFPEGSPRFPLVAVTGTNGKTTTVRMISRILSAWGLNVGMTSTDGVYIGERRIKKGDCSGPESARMVLFDPRVEAAVLEVARGGLIRGGLAYEEADVGVITNITGDHLGQDGVHTLEDLLFVKSLVVEQVKPGGYAVLNAGDIMSVEAGKRTKCGVIFFSDREDNLVLRKHLNCGGRGVYVRDGVVYLAWEGCERPLLKVKDIPATLKGIARHNVQNALAAAACAWALDVPPKIISRALREFDCSGDINPGRMNIMRMPGFTVMLDYGHNAAGFEAIINTAKSLKPGRMVGVIASPGDRRDEDIIALGRIAGRGFHRLIIKEDEDLRGRNPGEVASLLFTGALSAGLKRDKIEIILKEEDAIAYSLENAMEGDLVVIFYEHYEKALEAIKKSAAGVRRISGAVIV
ncbi:cyanophycin synthetase [Thermoanaerobacterium sp. DL9XJH110]|uniref:cyanophycin synthetase n=1 Tax=Thermoanaerobacterium sp. DL9XJH110 TaxID=3386643 RepID=UPI003BB70070